MRRRIRSAFKQGCHAIAGGFGPSATKWTENFGESLAGTGLIKGVPAQANNRSETFELPRAIEIPIYPSRVPRERILDRAFGPRARLQSSLGKFLAPS